MDYYYIVCTNVMAIQLTVGFIQLHCCPFSLMVIKKKVHVWNWPDNDENTLL